MCSIEKEVWARACRNCGIEETVCNRWLEKILAKYDSEPERIYHNSQILRSKCEQILELDAENQIPLSNSLAFAVFFQYYHFNVKSDCGDQNRDAFRSFCSEACLGDVSIYLTARFG